MVYVDPITLCVIGAVEVPVWEFAWANNFEPFFVGTVSFSRMSMSFRAIFWFWEIAKKVALNFLYNLH